MFNAYVVASAVMASDLAYRKRLLMGPGKVIALDRGVDLRAIDLPKTPRNSSNCPNCGAPHEPIVCSYCGTPA